MKNGHKRMVKINDGDGKLEAPLRNSTLILLGIVFFQLATSSSPSPLAPAWIIL
jgi:hypothetical protein